MSVFQNSFDGFARYGGRFLPAAAGGMAGVVAGNVLAAGAEAAVEVLTPDDGVDPFAGAGAGDAVAGWPVDDLHAAPVYELPLDSAEGMGAGQSFDLPAGAAFGGDSTGFGGSPADAWLNGHEFVGHTCSGTMDPSGEGNHVIMVDGHVLDLP